MTNTDFVLSRFREEAELLNESEFTQEHDELWQKRINIIISPDPRLSPEQREIIEMDYGMRDGELRIPTRAALVNYTLQAFNIDPHKYDVKAEAQQIIVQNRSELDPYLF